MEYNLLATTDGITQGQACSELWMNLRQIGDEKPKVNRSRVRGLIQGKTSIPTIEAIHRLRAHMTENPDRYKMVYRIIPILAWVPTELDKLVEEVHNQAKVIQENETFRITLEKRRTELRSKDVIEAVALDIDREVNLSQPDWVILIEIMGKETGISVIKPGDILNTQKEKYELMTKNK